MIKFHLTLLKFWIVVAIPGCMSTACKFWGIVFPFAKIYKLDPFTKIFVGFSYPFSRILGEKDCRTSHKPRFISLQMYNMKEQFLPTNFQSSSKSSEFRVQSNVASAKGVNVLTANMKIFEDGLSKNPFLCNFEYFTSQKAENYSIIHSMSLGAARPRCSIYRSYQPRGLCLF